METLTLLLVLLLVTYAFGEAAARLGQSAMVGQLVAGIALGTLAAQLGDLWPAARTLPQDPFFKAAIDLSIFFLMLLVGLEMRPSEIAETSVRAAVVAVGGMIVPLTLGLGLGWLYIPESPAKTIQALFLGTALAITAVPVTVKILMDLGRLRSRFGEVIVSAAIADDVIALFLLAVLTAMLSTGAPPEIGGIAALLLRVVLFFVIVVLAGIYLFPAIGRRLHRLRLPEPELSFVLIAGCAAGVLAELLGMHFIVGAFSAGLFFGPAMVGREIYDSVKAKIQGVTACLFAPIFFASIGFRADFTALYHIPVLTLILVVVAVLGKFFGAGIPAYLCGLTRTEATAVGVGMSARGAVELVIADVALRAGLFALPSPPPPIVANLFSAVVIMAVVTTLFASVALKRVLGADDS